MRIKASIGLLACACLAAPAVEAVELTKLERKIEKQPAYTAAQPLYGLVVIGPEAKSRIWMVLDKATEEAKRYEVLYADLNGNGDLTEPDERITASATSGGEVEFSLPDFQDPATGGTHTQFKLAARRDQTTHMVSLLWRGEEQEKMGGGYPEDPEDGYMHFAATPAEAPILWINGDGPFQFQRWYSSEFRIGGTDDLKVFLGNPGVGPNTFCAFQRHVLPEDEAVRYTLVYTDSDGKEHEVSGELPLRC